MFCDCGIARFAASGAILVAASLVTQGAAQAQVTYTDTTFGGYVTGFAATPAGTTFTAMQCASCGDPGQALRLTITDNSGAPVGAAVLDPLFTYDPLTQGAIGSISAAVDKNFTVTAPFNTYGNTFRLVIAQGGNYYTAVTFGTPVGANGGMPVSSGFASFTLSNLLATDFNQFDTLTGLVGTAHPSFTSGPITFGLGQVLAASPGTAGLPVTLVSDFDNLSITVQPAVPEPSTWALMVLGVGAIGYTLRRRQATVLTRLA